MSFEETGVRPGMEAASQRLPEPRHPWRRFFARSLDLSICQLLWYTVLALLFHVNLSFRIGWGEILDTVVGLGMMVLAEPLFLHLWGTTPGKAVFGLRITKRDGGRLTYGEGLERAWGVLGQGMGYSIPIYNLVRQWKSYQLCRDKKPQPWEGDYRYTIQDTAAWRWAAFAGCTGAVLAALALLMGAAGIPPNRGKLTVAEFAENYNRLAAYHKEDLGYRYLDGEGKWRERPGYVPEVNLNHKTFPEFVYETRDGVITAISFVEEQEGADQWVWSSATQMQLAALAYPGAQRELGAFSRARGEMAALISREGDRFQAFQFTQGAVRVSCQVSMEGYLNSSTGLLLPDETAPRHHYRLEFRMEQVP